MTVWWCQCHATCGIPRSFNSMYDSFLAEIKVAIQITSRNARFQMNANNLIYLKLTTKERSLKINNQKPIENPTMIVLDTGNLEGITLSILWARTKTKHANRQRKYLRSGNRWLWLCGVFVGSGTPFTGKLIKPGKKHCEKKFSRSTSELYTGCYTFIQYTLLIAKLNGQCACVHGAKAFTFQLNCMKFNMIY